MPALSPLHSLPVRALRATCALVGILLLLLQTVGPALASPGQSMWVEICSEAGAVWVQIDLEEEDLDPTAPCPKCADCALCAITSAAPVPNLPVLARDSVIHTEHPSSRDLVEICSLKRLWPETRGPPAAPKKHIERAQRARIASIQVSGGALWS